MCVCFFVPLKLINLNLDKITRSPSVVKKTKQNKQGNFSRLNLNLGKRKRIRVYVRVCKQKWLLGCVFVCVIQVLLVCVCVLER